MFLLAGKMKLKNRLKRRYYRILCFLPGSCVGNFGFYHDFINLA